MRSGGGEDGLRVELDALDGKLSVAQAHDDAVGGGGRDFERIGDRARVHDQGMVARGGKRWWEATKDRLAVVLHLCCLPVDQRRGRNHLSAKNLANPLMAQAHSENWNLAGEVANRLHQDAGVS